MARSIDEWKKKERVWLTLFNNQSNADAKGKLGCRRGSPAAAWIQISVIYPKFTFIFALHKMSYCIRNQFATSMWPRAPPWLHWRRQQRRRWIVVIVSSRALIRPRCLSCARHQPHWSQPYTSSYGCASFFFRVTWLNKNYSLTAQWTRSCNTSCFLCTLSSARPSWLPLKSGSFHSLLVFVNVVVVVADRGGGIALRAKLSFRTK